MTCVKLCTAKLMIINQNYVFFPYIFFFLVALVYYSVKNTTKENKLFSFNPYIHIKLYVYLIYNRK